MLRKQCTRIKDVCSPFHDSNTGVPHGSILGQIVFSLYINDLLWFRCMQMIELFILMIRSINKIETKRTSCYSKLLLH